jgi:hypothetical protein
MANIKERAGSVQVRVGGNTQESAELVQSLPNGTTLAKDTSNTFNPTGTPPLAYTPDLLYLMGNISALTNTRWYLGWCQFSLDSVKPLSNRVRYSIFQHYSFFSWHSRTGSSDLG